jgi:hypothetical protein
MFLPEGKQIYAQDISFSACSDGSTNVLNEEGGIICNTRLRLYDRDNHAFADLYNKIAAENAVYGANWMKRQFQAFFGIPTA